MRRGSPNGVRAAGRSLVGHVALGIRGQAAPEWSFGPPCGRTSTDSER